MFGMTPPTVPVATIKSPFTVVPTEINLPANPLPGNTGEIMIKSYYSTEDSQAYYLVYDTNGGKSMQYYWNGTDHKWNGFEINLPAQPLLGK